MIQKRNQNQRRIHKTIAWLLVQAFLIKESHLTKFKNNQTSTTHHGSQIDLEKQTNHKIHLENNKTQEEWMLNRARPPIKPDDEKITIPFLNNKLLTKVTAKEFLNSKIMNLFSLLTIEKVDQKFHFTAEIHLELHKIYPTIARLKWEMEYRDFWVYKKVQKVLNFTTKILSSNSSLTSIEDNSGVIEGVLEYGFDLTSKNLKEKDAIFWDYYSQHSPGIMITLTKPLFLRVQSRTNTLKYDDIRMNKFRLYSMKTDVYSRLTITTLTLASVGVVFALLHISYLIDLVKADQRYPVIISIGNFFYFIILTKIVILFGLKKYHSVILSCTAAQIVIGLLVAKRKYIEKHGKKIVFNSNTGVFLSISFLGAFYTAMFLSQLDPEYLPLACTFPCICLGLKSTPNPQVFQEMILVLLNTGYVFVFTYLDFFTDSFTKFIDYPAQERYILVVLMVHILLGVVFAFRALATKKDDRREPEEDVLNLKSGIKFEMSATRLDGIEFGEDEEEDVKEAEYQYRGGEEGSEFMSDTPEELDLMSRTEGVGEHLDEEFEYPDGVPIDADYEDYDGSEGEEEMFEEEEEKVMGVAMGAHGML